MIKRIQFLFLIPAFLFQTLNLRSQSVNYKLDNGKCLIQWSADKVTGSHNGVINVSNGVVMMENDQITGAKIFIDMQSIRNLDIKDPESKTKLENDLKSENFFNSSSYPEAIFKVYKINKLEDSEEYTHTIEGSLTIKGYTNKLIFPVKIEKKNNKIYIVGSTQVDRTLFDIKYRSGKFYDDLGDFMIYDLFNIKFNIVAVPPKE